jgi:hypothetical protein
VTGSKPPKRWTRQRLRAIFSSPADTLGSTLGVGLVVTITGGMILAVVLVLLNLDGGNSSTTSERSARSPVTAHGVPCTPAMKFTGFNEGPLPSGAHYVGSSPPPGTYGGQIEGGDILRVRGPGRGEYSDSVTVQPGAVVTVGLRVYNPGGGNAGGVLAHVDLPRTADNALELRARIDFDGPAGKQVLTDTAAILVKPSRARACARYIAGSSEEQRHADGELARMSLDWIVSKGGANFGRVSSLDRQMVFFKVVVV